MWGGEWRSFLLVSTVLVCLALFPSHTSAIWMNLFKVVAPIKCDVNFYRNDGCMGDALHASEIGDFNFIDEECCGILEKLDEDCVPGFLKWASPFTPSSVKKRCSEFAEKKKLINIRKSA